MARSEKGKQQGDAQRIRPIIRPWAKEFRRFNKDGKWPTFTQIRDGINLLRGPDTITMQSRSAINKFMTECRQHEEKVGNEAFMPQALKIAKPKTPKKPPKTIDKDAAPDEERTTLTKNLAYCRTLVEQCVAGAENGNPDFHGFAKIVDQEAKLARRSDELVHESRRSAKSPKESRLDLTLHLSTVDAARAEESGADK